MSPRLPSLLTIALLAAAACGDDDPPAAATTAYFDLDADLGDRARFFDLPFPSDLRRDADGSIALAGYPVREEVDLFVGLRDLADEAQGFHTMPVIYVRFDAPLRARDLEAVIPAEASSPILLVDVDPESPARGELVPTVATPLGADDYAPDHLLAIAARPGFVLRADTTYAVVVRRGLGDAEGKPLGVPAALAELMAGRAPAGSRGAEALALYAPLVETLATLGVPADDVAAATVFTTGDVVAETKAISDGLLARDTATIGPLQLDPDDGATHPRFCELHATLSLPNYQQGEEPYDTEGHFVIGPDGLPVVQKTLDVPMVLTIPKQEMPASGYPLVLYFHGSGGLAAQVVDRGWRPEGGEETKGEGPAHVVAAHGFAAAGSALPVNPERVPGALEIEYLNFGNLDAFPFLFRQGVIEQRMFLSALVELRIDPATLAGCDGPTLPMGETQFKLDPGQLYAQGQSMGGMYTNMIGAVEPRFRALVPTGAGGYWPLMLPHSSGFTQLLGFLPVLLDTDEPLSWVHPGMHLLELAWEPAEPFVSMPRLSRRPLPGVPARPVYEPVGYLDTYFGPTVYEAVVLAYGHPQAGEVVWPEMQESLALAGLDGLLAYPVADNLVSENGDSYTAAVVQYQGDGYSDPHSIYAQLDAVKYQYGCFLETMLKTGTAKILAPKPLGTPCN